LIFRYLSLTVHSIYICHGRERERLTEARLGEGDGDDQDLGDKIDFFVLGDEEGCRSRVG
jgi:hypothetical protein